MRLFIYRFIILFAFCAIGTGALAQEFETAIPDNALLSKHQRTQTELRGRTVLSLPFFEDFADSNYYPNLAHWQDSMVYINNSIGLRNKSLGTATFDALNAKGEPYTNSLFLSVLADSLTSQYFDFSTRNPSDSIYLSFLFQGKGNGYAPAAGDSLMLYFQRSNGAWVKVWDKAGAAMNVFETAMVPVKDTMFFHPDFRFRLVNKATFNVGNSHWNVDNIRMNVNRNYQDSVGNDVAFSYWGNADFNRSLTGEYMAMPYRHFNANRNQHFTGTIGLSMWNSWYTTKEFAVGLRIKNKATGASYNAPTQNTFALYNDAQTLDIPVADNSGVLSTNTDELIIDMEAFFTQPIAGDFSQINDTIRHQQIFGNYFAYDDGSAESAFFMSSYQGIPAYVAQEYALTVADTLRGVDIYLPRQLPEASSKLFYLQVYKKIDAVGGVNELVYEQTDLYPQYQERINGFVTYKFANAVPMDAGTFYIAMMFPAGGMSDSLYIGLDKNKKGANYRYFKVGDHWQSSLIDGALMLRPLVGKPLPLSMSNVKKAELDIDVYPNPVGDWLNIEWKTATENPAYYISDALGRVLKSGKITTEKIDCSSFSQGIYYLNIRDAKGYHSSKKFYKN